MRNTILVALLIALVTVVGCKEKASQPAENAMNSTDTQSMEKPKKEMQGSSEAMADPAASAEAPASGDSADAPAGGEVAEAPASGEGAGTAQ